MIKLKCKSAEFQKSIKKRKELTKKKYETSSKRYEAKKDLKFAEKIYKIARLNNLKKIVERIALIKMIQKEVQFAQIQFDQTKKLKKKIEFKEKIINALSLISLIKNKITRHNVLLK